MSSSGNSLISPRLFVQSVQDLGLDTIDAVNEFVDNSFDASAQNVWITIETNERGGLRMVIEDDGTGIPREQLVEVLKFGGKLDRSQDEPTTGKFGFGLPSSAFCQADRTEIYSKTADQDEFWFNRLDISELEDMDEIEIPDEEQRDPPFGDLTLDGDVEQGTVIILPHLRNPDRQKVRYLTEHISSNLSRIQREILTEGRSIHVNDSEIPIRDPTMWLEESKEVQDVGQAKLFEHYEFDYPEEAASDDDPHTIEVDLFILPVKQIVRDSLQSEYNINQSNQGFYIIRKNREIGDSQTLHIFTRHNSLNYFRARIRFPPALDNKFGVQTNKSRFALAPDLRQEMEEKLKPSIDQIQNEIERLKNQAKKELDELDGFSRSEETANKKSRLLPRSDHEPDEEVVETQVSEAKTKKQELEERGDVPEDQKEAELERLETIISGDQYVTVKEESPPTGNFYDVIWNGKELRVMINPNHIFYDRLYKPLESDDINITDSETKYYLELLLITLAKAEDQQYRNKQVKKFYERERRNWSQILYDLYDNVDSYLDE